MLTILWKVHRRVFKISGGRLGGRVIGMPVLLLTSTGRKSGEAREVALTYLADGDRFVVAASNAGHTTHPAWWLNLAADPDGTVQIGKQITPVRAREADGDERERLWARFVEASDDYAEYEERTDRTIPVVVLESR